MVLSAAAWETPSGRGDSPDGAENGHGISTRSQSDTDDSAGHRQPADDTRARISAVWLAALHGLGHDGPRVAGDPTDVLQRPTERQAVRLREGPAGGFPRVRSDHVLRGANSRHRSLIQ